MTTKFRIIAGFLVILVLLAVMAFMGYSSLQRATNSFTDYRRMANINVDCSDLQSVMYEILYFADEYLSSKDPAKITEALHRVDRGHEIAEHILETSALQANIDRANASKASLDNMKTALNNMQARVENVFSTLENEVAPNMAITDDLVNKLQITARNIDNGGAAFYLTEIWKKIAVIRENLMGFLGTLSEDSGFMVLDNLDEVQTEVANLGTTLVTETGRVQHQQIEDAFAKAIEGLNHLVQAGADARAARQELTEQGQEVLGMVTEMNQQADALMRENGAATLAANAGAQTQMLVVSIAGMLLGIGLAVYIIYALVRALTRMSAYASDIANGEFHSKITVNEKGEIGAMFQAMRKIPEIFADVLEQSRGVANDIASGKFRNRLDLDKLQGGFRDLAIGINTIADSYTEAIDNMPVSIISLDTSLRTEFTNATGLEVVGPDTLQAFGGSMPSAEACIRDDEMKKSENRLTSPGGDTVEVAVTVIPLHDMSGKSVGALEVLADITEIKEKQNLMLQVASEASAISDRVAAAAEELSAQVEQVSQGAEIQRSRVESTASAMAEMNATVSEVARSASEASHQSEDTRVNAQNGSELVNKVVSAINQVQVVASRLETNMQALGEQAESIGSVMNVISDIADQTNLLALNAAIEAARAGEAGRGFAVVADEVRKLAEKTMTATKEVGDNITAIQQSTQVNIQEVTAAGKSVSEATELANNSGAALQDIVNLASATSSVVTSIATAAEEQSAASDEITQAVDEINRLVSETTQGMIQSSAAVQDLSRIAQELNRVMDGLK